MSTRFAQPRAAGFTLVEMLAVLTLAALMSAVALPAMQRWFDSVSQRAQLSEIAVQFQKLAARAALLAQTVELSQASARAKLSDGEPVLSLPEGWSVVSSKPVVFFYSGICDGGTVDLIGPEQRRVSLRIAPVNCAVSLLR